MACIRVRSPAFTKLTTITVVALDDWITVVMPNPVSTPLKGLDVMEERKFLNLSPAAFWSPALIMFIPNRNIPRAPSSVRICNIISRLFDYFLNFINVETLDFRYRFIRVWNILKELDVAFTPFGTVIDIKFHSLAFTLFRYVYLGFV